MEFSQLSGYLSKNFQLNVELWKKNASLTKSFANDRYLTEFNY